jgi:hypothetical protein
MQSGFNGFGFTYGLFDNQLRNGSSHHSGPDVVGDDGVVRLAIGQKVPSNYAAATKYLR